MKIVLREAVEIEGFAPTPYETAQWWKWVLSIPRPANPLESGNSDISQIYPFLCLACTGGGSDTSRTLYVHSNFLERPILIPIFTSEYSTVELGPDAEYEELLRLARSDVQDPRRLELVIDDTAITNIKNLYVESPLFSFDLPNNSILGEVQCGVYRGVSAGYWLKISPFSSGNHTILFGGEGQNGFFTQVGYEIKVPAKISITR